MVRDKSSYGAPLSLPSLIPSGTDIRNRCFKSHSVEPGKEAKQRKLSKSFSDSLLNGASINMHKDARAKVAARLQALKNKQTPVVRKPLPSQRKILKGLKLAPPPVKDDDADFEESLLQRRRSQKKVKEWESKKKRQSMKENGKMSPKAAAATAAAAAEPPKLSTGGMQMLMFSLCKVKAAGMSIRRKWELEKQNEKDINDMQAREMRELVQRRELAEQKKFEAIATHSKVTPLVSTKKLVYEMLMHESQVMNNDLHRISSADKHHVLGDNDVRRPDSAEAWELGLDVLNLKDSLNSIAHGSEAPPAVKRASLYPEERPFLPESEKAHIVKQEVKQLKLQKWNLLKKKQFEAKKGKSLFDVSMAAKQKKTAALEAMSGYQPADKKKQKKKSLWGGK